MNWDQGFDEKFLPDTAKDELSAAGGIRIPGTSLSRSPSGIFLSHCGAPEFSNFNRARSFFVLNFVKNYFVIVSRRPVCGIGNIERYVSCDSAAFTLKLFRLRFSSAFPAPFYPKT